MYSSYAAQTTLRSSASSPLNMFSKRDNSMFVTRNFGWSLNYSPLLASMKIRMGHRLQLRARAKLGQRISREAASSLLGQRSEAVGHLAILFFFRLEITSKNWVLFQRYRRSGKYVYREPWVANYHLRWLYFFDNHAWYCPKFCPVIILSSTSYAQCQASRLEGTQVNEASSWTPSSFLEQKTKSQPSLAAIWRSIIVMIIICELYTTEELSPAVECGHCYNFRTWTDTVVINEAKLSGFCTRHQRYRILVHFFSKKHSYTYVWSGFFVRASNFWFSCLVFRNFSTVYSSTESILKLSFSFG